MKRVALRRQGVSKTSQTEREADRLARELCNLLFKGQCGFGCGREGSDWCHIAPRSFKSLRHDMRNCLWGCRECHALSHANEAAFLDWLQMHYSVHFECWEFKNRGGVVLYDPREATNSLTAAFEKITGPDGQLYLDGMRASLQLPDLGIVTSFSEFLTERNVSG